MELNPLTAYTDSVRPPRFTILQPPMLSQSPIHMIYLIFFGCFSSFPALKTAVTQSHHPMYSYVYHTEDDQMQFDWLIVNSDNAGTNFYKCTYIKLNRKFLKNKQGYVYVDRKCDRASHILMCQKRISSSKLPPKRYPAFDELIFPKANLSWVWPMATVVCNDVGFRVLDYLQAHKSSQCFDSEEEGRMIQKRFSLSLFYMCLL